MTDQKNRQPKGTPSGGEFAKNEHDEAASLAVPESAPIPYETEGGYVAVGNHLVWGDGVENRALDWTYKTRPEFKSRYLAAGNPRLMEVVGTKRVPDEPSSRILLVDLGDGGEPVEVGVHREGSITIDERDLDFGD